MQQRGPKINQNQLRRSLTKVQHEWLFEAESLTDKMSKNSDKDFSVKQLPVSAVIGREKRFLRRVVLYYQGSPWVYAETEVKWQHLGWRNCYLNLLGNRSIGTYVLLKFALPKRAFAVEKVTRADPINLRLRAEFACPDQEQWSRRSTYQWGKCYLTIRELFLPASGV